MEIDKAWALDIHISELKRDGIVLDSDYTVKFDRSDIEKHHTLYYLKSRDVFVTVQHDNNKLQVLSDSSRIRSFRERYFNEMEVVDTNNFTEIEIDEYSIFKSEFDLNDIAFIKSHGHFLEKIETNDVYYLESLDAFANILDVENRAYLFQDNSLRKKYNIPYQDERFASLSN